MFQYLLNLKNICRLLPVVSIKSDSKKYEISDIEQTWKKSVFNERVLLNRIADAKRNYALRTCIDLKPWEGEDQYVRIFQGGGCYSYIGWAYYTQQVLSIGTRCNSQG